MLIACLHSRFSAFTREKSAAKNGTKREVSKQYFYDCMGREGRFYKIFVYDFCVYKMGVAYLSTSGWWGGEYMGNWFCWFGRTKESLQSGVSYLFVKSSSFVCLCYSHGWWFLLVKCYILYFCLVFLITVTSIQWDRSEMRVYSITHFIIKLLEFYKKFELCYSRGWQPLAFEMRFFKRVMLLIFLLFYTQFSTLIGSF